MDHLERQYLLAAYEVANGPSRVFNADDVANYVDLDPSEPGYADRFVSLAQYHLDRGFLAPDSKVGLKGSRALRITAKGQEARRSHRAAEGATQGLSPGRLRVGGRQPREVR